MLICVAPFQWDYEPILTVERNRFLRMQMIQRISTGISGLDELIEGGFPARRVLLVIGGPGSGKTIFAAQFLVNGALSSTGKVLYVSLEEKKDDFYREMLRFGWDLAKLEREDRFVFADGTETMGRPPPQPSVLPRFGRGDSSSPLLGLIEFEIQQVHPERLVIDPISSLALQFPDLIDRRGAILKLVSLLASSGATSIMTLELRGRDSAREVQLEEYLSHGVVILRSMKSGARVARAIVVEKMRETEVDPNPRPYRIERSGIVVFPKESVM